MLDQLIRVMEKHYDHFTLLKFNTGWKAVIGTPHLENSEDPKSHYQRLFRIKGKPTIEKAILDCIERGEDAENKF
jgi:hypothetical protein